MIRSKFCNSNVFFSQRKPRNRLDCTGGLQVNQLDLGQIFEAPSFSLIYLLKDGDFSIAFLVYLPEGNMEQSDMFGSFFCELICVLAVGCSPDRDFSCSRLSPPGNPGTSRIDMGWTLEVLNGKLSRISAVRTSPICYDFIIREDRPSSSMIF